MNRKQKIAELKKEIAETQSVIEKGQGRYPEKDEALSGLIHQYQKDLDRLEQEDFSVSSKIESLKKRIEETQSDLDSGDVMEDDKPIFLSSIEKWKKKIAELEDE